MDSLNIKINNETLINYKFEWVPLNEGNRNLFIWQYHQTKNLPNRATIYRHVVHCKGVGMVTLYVGEGASLNGPYKYNLVYQYNGQHGETRMNVKKYINNYIRRKKSNGWTEILNINTKGINLEDKKFRKALESTFIAVYFFQYQKLTSSLDDAPLFQNKL